MDTETKDWLVKLTECVTGHDKLIAKLDKLASNHYTEMKAKQDMTWKVVAVIGVSLIPMISLIISLLVLVVRNG